MSKVPESSPAVEHPDADQGSGSKPVLSAVVPVYQEHAVIGGVASRLAEVLERTGSSYEIILVDDGSTDGSREVLEALKEQIPRHLRVIRHPYNKGNGAAIKTGIRAARGSVIACLDGDGQHDPEDLLRMLPYMAEHDLVVGARTQAYEGVWYRNLANRIYNSLASWLSDFPIEDLTSGYRLFRAEAIKRYLHLLPARFSYPTTSTLALLKGGYNIKYVPVKVENRQHGRSKVRVMRDGWRFFAIIFKIIVVFEPLRVFLPVAVISFFLALLSSLYSTWALGRLHIPNSAVFLLVLSVLVLLLGLVSEQIAELRLSLRDENTTRSDRD